MYAKCPHDIIKSPNTEANSYRISIFYCFCSQNEHILEVDRMKSFNRKSTSLFLALFMVLLASCASSEGTAETTTAEPAGSVTETETEAEIMDAVPELDFGGESLTYTTVSWYDYEIYAEEQNGEITNDSVFNRNKKMEERFNVVIESIPVDNGSHTEHPNYIRKSIMAQDNSFDIAATFVYTAGTLVLENLFLDWTEIPYVDLTQPWWVKNINNAFTVNDTLYTAVSDTCITSLQLAYAYLFNEKLAANYDVEDLYAVVEEGRWTLDYLYNLTKDLYLDVNGDGTRDTGDFYGLLTDINTSVDCYLMTSGQPILNVTDNGFEVMLGTDKANQIYEKVYRLIYENDGTFWYWHGNQGYMYDDKYAIFKKDSALVMPVRLSALYNQLRDMESNYGILPFPKYDESQSEYYSTCLDNYSVLCIPNNAENPEMIGALSEAMACESKKTVIPAYYESALQGKYSRDAKSVEMLDLIMDGRTYDLSVLYSASAGGAYGLFTSTMRSGNMFASAYAASEKKIKNSVEKLYTQLMELGEPS